MPIELKDYSTEELCEELETRRGIQVFRIRQDLQATFQARAFCTRQGQETVRVSRPVGSNAPV